MREVQYRRDGRLCDTLFQRAQDHGFLSLQRPLTLGTPSPRDRRPLSVPSSTGWRSPSAMLAMVTRHDAKKVGLRILSSQVGRASGYRVLAEQDAGCHEAA
jgi:hypothetical protein